MGLFLDGGPTSGTVALLSPIPSTGVYQWKVPDFIFQGDAGVQLQPGSYKLKSILYDGKPCLGFCPLLSPSVKAISQDFSDAPFSIVAKTSIQPSLTVTSPNGGESWVKGQSYFIKWSQSGFPSDGWIQIQLRDAVNSSSMAKLITQSAPLGTYSGSFNWTIPSDIPDGKYLVWVTAGSVSIPDIAVDFSVVPFSIAASAPAVVTVARDAASPFGNITGGAKAAQLFRFNVAAPADRNVTLISVTLEFGGSGLSYLSNIRVVDSAADAAPYTLPALSNVTSYGADPMVAGLGQITLPADGVRVILIQADVSPFTSCSTCSLAMWVRLTGLAVDTSTSQFSISGLPVEGHQIYLIPSSFSSATKASSLASVLEAIQAQVNSIAEKIKQLQRQK